MGLQPGVGFTTKGFQMDDVTEYSGYSFDYSGKVILYYFHIPVDVKFRFDVGLPKLYVSVGPYIGMGIYGKYVVDVEGESSEEDVVWGIDEDEHDFKRPDFGLSIGGGIEISIVQIGLSYSAGIANISPYIDEGYAIQNRVMEITVSLFFGG